MTARLATWRPHVTLDLHNGGSQPYNLCYQCSSAYDPDQELTPWSGPQLGETGGHIAAGEVDPTHDAAHEG